MSEQIITKRCSKCKQTKPLSGFYKNRSMHDGYGNQCKMCFLKSDAKYRLTEKGKASQKKYHQSEKGKIAKKRYRIHRPEQVKAQRAVNHAVIIGKLVRPNTLVCRYCGAKAQKYHHHKGYARECWFDIVPVCNPCHIKQHS